MLLITDRLKAELVKALLGINDGVDDGSRSLGNVDSDDISLGALHGIVDVLELERGQVMFCKCK